MLFDDKFSRAIVNFDSDRKNAKNHKPKITNKKERELRRKDIPCCNCIGYNFFSRTKQENVQVHLAVSVDTILKKRRKNLCIAAIPSVAGVFFSLEFACTPFV